MQRRTFLIVGVIVFLLLVGLIIRYSFTSVHQTAILNIEVAPAGAKVQISGKGARAGKRRVVPGQYTVGVALNGFIAENRQVTATAKKETYVGVSLVPNTSATNSWYATHPADAKKAEAISSHNFDAASAELTDNPLIKKLPYIGAGFEFRIDYGVPRDRNKPGQPIIYIQAASAVARADSLKWIRSFGYDPANMDIVFKDAVNPFTGSKDQ